MKCVGTAPSLYTVAMLWRRERWAVAVLCVISPAASPIISIARPPPQSRLAKNRLDPKIWAKRGPIIQSRCNIGFNGHLHFDLRTQFPKVAAIQHHHEYQIHILSIACNCQHYIYMGSHPFWPLKLRRNSLNDAETL